ncbi:MAG: GNAT family N-acetyltransferase [Psychromonas sp.]|nr:GNAT family N-acetyltransferase [Psychromonas sp.]
MNHRVILRSLKTTDKSSVVVLLTDSDVMAFLGPKRALDATEAQQWFESELASPSRYVVALKETNELIGFCGMKVIDGITDFGYFFRKAFWGQGYASEACLLAIEQLSNEIDITSLQVFIAKKNSASLGLAKKLNWFQLNDVVKNDEQGYYFQIRH